MQCLSSMVKEKSEQFTERLKKVISTNDLDCNLFKEVFDSFNDFGNTFKDLENHFLSDIYFEEKGMITPLEFVLGYRIENVYSKGIYKMVNTKESYQYISIFSILKRLFSSEYFVNIVFDCLQLGKNKTVDDIDSIYCGSFFKSKFKDNYIALEMFIDDIECGDSLSSRSGINMLSNVMISIKDLPPKFYSSIDWFFPVLIFYAIDVKKYSYSPIFDPLITDLNNYIIMVSLLTLSLATDLDGTM